MTMTRQYINLTPMGPLVAKATEAARSAIERQAVDAWQPYVIDGTIRAEQPMVVAIGRRRCDGELREAVTQRGW